MFLATDKFGFGGDCCDGMNLSFLLSLPSSPDVKAKPSVLSSVKPELMIRKFSVAEKLGIIDEVKELNNVSATYR